MNLARIAVLGGGPGGLFAARLLKLRHPGAEVVVYEQNPPDRTFGFGVGLPAGAQRNLRAADNATVDAIEAAGRRHDAAMQVGSRALRFGDFSTIAIARTELLAVLRKQAEEVGVDIRFGEHRSVDQLDADLIIAADGVNSPTREQFADSFGAHVSTSAGLYLWCGTEFALEHAVFAPCHTSDGTFVTHAYPYADNASTFLIETDEATWQNAGFSVEPEYDDPGASDEKSIAYLESAFAEVLDGRRLVGNRTRWLRFRTVQCERWHHENIVLLGDAAHTAHYSIGSGTKLAMEDAIELDRALADEASIPEALEAYETRRRQSVTDLQAVARRSELWWESFPNRTDLPLEQLMVAYMTRAGKVSIDRFLDSTPDIARRGLAQYGGLGIEDVPSTDANAWILQRPLTRSDMMTVTRHYSSDPAVQGIGLSCTIDGRDAPAEDAVPAHIVDVPSGMLWTDDRRAFVERNAPTNRTVIWLRGAATRSDLQDRLEIGDEFRRLTGKVVAVSATPEFREDFVSALASGRIDIAIETSDHDHAPSVAHRLLR
ncbi:FAD-dependent monooxygenase [Rhodococcus erythropolis]|uniref:FAD-dependent monooxygenase n=1 Tax=Rhodococcus erythropolis TaxID=1833 RepID=UPI0008786E5A|nr:FAD-dependent monooxygenase [Rhodococcus erythropolis]OFV75260.1 putative tryptophan hydroxylase VioD [Rhodococcus erythropolis]